MEGVTKRLKQSARGGGKTPAQSKKRVYRDMPNYPVARGMMVGYKESGFVDLNSASYNADTTGTVTLIATIPQGASVNQRVGKKVMLKSVQVRGACSVNSTTTITDVAGLLVYDRRPTGSLPAVTDILASASSAAFNNDANSGRFRILRRWDHVLTGNNVTPATGNESVSMDTFVKVKNLTVFKALGTGAIADIEEGALYFVTVGDRAAGTTAATFGVAFRTRFVDF